MPRSGTAGSRSACTQRTSSSPWAGAVRSIHCTRRIALPPAPDSTSPQRARRRSWASWSSSENATTRQASTDVSRRPERSDTDPDRTPVVARPPRSRTSRNCGGATGRGRPAAAARGARTRAPGRRPRSPDRGRTAAPEPRRPSRRHRTRASPAATPPRCGPRPARTSSPARAASSAAGHEHAERRRRHVEHDDPGDAAGGDHRRLTRAHRAQQPAALQRAERVGEAPLAHAGSSSGSAGGGGPAAQRAGRRRRAPADRVGRSVGVEAHRAKHLREVAVARRGPERVLSARDPVIGRARAVGSSGAAFGGAWEAAAPRGRSADSRRRPRAGARGSAPSARHRSPARRPPAPSRLGALGFAARSPPAPSRRVNARSRARQARRRRPRSSSPRPRRRPGRPGRAVPSSAASSVGVGGALAPGRRPPGRWPCRWGRRPADGGARELVQRQQPEHRPRRERGQQHQRRARQQRPDPGQRACARAPLRPAPARRRWRTWTRMSATSSSTARAAQIRRAGHTIAAKNSGSMSTIT